MQTKFSFRAELNSIGKVAVFAASYVTVALTIVTIGGRVAQAILED